MMRVLFYVGTSPDKAQVFDSVAAMLAHLPGLLWQDHTGLSEDFRAYEKRKTRSEIPPNPMLESVELVGMARWLDVGTIGNSMYALQREQEEQARAAERDV